MIVTTVSEKIRETCPQNHMNKALMRKSRYQFRPKKVTQLFYLPLNEISQKKIMKHPVFNGIY